MTDSEATVVIVDDDAAVRRGLERLLRSAGYRVETFASAREFLQCGDFDRVGCLVLDIRMPGQTGLELHEVLVADDHHIPIIFITGDDDVPIAMSGLKDAAVDVLTKPFVGPTLLDAVQLAIVKGRQRRRADDRERPDTSGIGESRGPVA